LRSRVSIFYLLSCIAVITNSHSFPTRRSSDLVRGPAPSRPARASRGAPQQRRVEQGGAAGAVQARAAAAGAAAGGELSGVLHEGGGGQDLAGEVGGVQRAPPDRRGDPGPPGEGEGGRGAG